MAFVNQKGERLFRRRGKNKLTLQAPYGIFYRNGAVAQMGERVTGSHKVVGSIPISSTNDIKGLANES